MPYFIRVPNPDQEGDFIYQQVADDQIEVPDEVFKKKVFEHPAYKKVVDESIKRKKSLQAMKVQLEELQKPADENDAVDGQEPNQNDGGKPAATGNEPPPLDKEKLYEEFLQRMEQQQAAKEQAARVEADKLNALIAKHHLTPDALVALQEAKNPEALAAWLEKATLRFDDQEGGAPSSQDELDALSGRVLKNLGLD